MCSTNLGKCTDMQQRILNQESLENEIVPKSDSSESDRGDNDRRSKDKDARSSLHQRKVVLKPKEDRAREPSPED